MNTQRLTTGQLAKVMGVSRGAVWKWAKGYGLPCDFTLGGQRRYDLAEVMAFVERRKAERQEAQAGPGN